MPPRLLAAVAALLMMLLAATGVRGEGPGIGILSLRLGMPLAEVLNRLAIQGMSASGGGLHLIPPACAATVEHDGAVCPRRIEARTQDGLLVIRFAAMQGAPAVARIDYAIIARGPADYQRVRAAAIGHYGPPMRLDPLSWCDGPDPCPHGATLLTFRPASDVAARLALRAAP